MLANTPAGGAPAVRRQWLDLSALPPGPFQRVYAYWAARKGARLAPSRRDIDPIDLREVLERTLLIDVARDPWRFSYRLAGTLTERIHGMDLTGRSIDTLKPEAFADMLREDFIKLAETAAPQFVRLEFVNQMGLQRGYHVLRLPLSSDGAQVDMLLIVSDYSGDYKAMTKFFEGMSG
jgi:hypothetical protein